jgi:hypothetical protein
MSETKFSNYQSEDGSTGPDLVGITSFTSPYYFVPPSGTTAERPSGDGLAPGMLRFNTDIGRLEVWRGDHWATILGESPSLNGGARGLLGGGYDGPANYNLIDYITISSTGNSIDFGDLTVIRREAGGCASATRGLWAGGAGAARENTIDYVTIASTGNAQDFGDLTVGRNAHNTGLSNSTRGCWGSGLINAAPNLTNTIDYVTIASTGNAQDFGDLTQSVFESTGTSSSTRGLWGGGAPTNSNIIGYITISTLGNAFDFGDLTTSDGGHSACSNSTRALFQSAGTIGYVTISSLGNAVNFGTLTNTNSNKGACSSSTRGVFAGGGTSNVIEYVTILTTGNGVDFGDITNTARNRLSGLSNGHGGL